MSQSLPQPPRRRILPGFKAEPIVKEEETDCDTCDTLKRLDQIVHASPEEESNSPPGLMKIGHAGWSLLHTIAAYYPDKPTEHQQLMASNFLQSLGVLFPCHNCADDFSEYLQEHPPTLSSRREFSLWMCNAHNAVNQKLDKPIFPCDQVDQRWRVSVDDDL